MLEAKLTIAIEAPALTDAMHSLAAALLDSLAQAGTCAEHAAKNQPAPVSAPALEPEQVPAPAPAAIPAPEAPASVVPLSPAPSYTMEQVAKAGSELLSADPSKLPELLALLERHGVKAVQDVPAEELGAFATALRGLGAKL